MQRCSDLTNVSRIQLIEIFDTARKIQDFTLANLIKIADEKRTQPTWHNRDFDVETFGSESWRRKLDPKPPNDSDLHKKISMRERENKKQSKMFANED